MLDPRLAQKTHSRPQPSCLAQGLHAVCGRPAPAGTPGILSGTCRLQGRSPTPWRAQPRGWHLSPPATWGNIGGLACRPGLWLSCLRHSREGSVDPDRPSPQVESKLFHCLWQLCASPVAPGKQGHVSPAEGDSEVHLPLLLFPLPQLQTRAPPFRTSSTPSHFHPLPEREVAAHPRGTAGRQAAGR